MVRKYTKGKIKLKFKEGAIKYYQCKPDPIPIMQRELMYAFLDDLVEQGVLNKVKSVK